MSIEPWVVLVDARRAKLLRVSVGEEGHVRLDTRQTLESQWEHADPGRPSQYIPKRNGHANPGTGHDVEENVRRFALEFRDWLHRAIDKHRIERVEMFASPRLLGLFRKLLPAAVAAHVREHTGDLVSMTTEQLREHPAITALLQPATSRR